MNNLPIEIVVETDEEFLERVSKRVKEIDAGDRTPITHKTVSIPFPKERPEEWEPMVLESDYDKPG